jgi:glycogen(starch) synthase
MRLLFITENYPPDRGGMAESCDRIVRGLTALDVAVDIVHFDRRCAASAYRETSRGSVTRVAAEADVPHTINLLWNRIQRMIDLRAVTHVVAFGGTLPLLSAPAFAAWAGKPLVTLIRGNELDTGLFDPRRRPVLDDALQRSAVVCTVTTAQAEKIRALHPDCETRVIANGIDFDLWQPTAADVARAQRWRTDNVASGRRVLGCFGHLKAKKGLPFFVESLLRSSVADRFHLLLIGEIEESLQAMLTGASLAHTLLPPLERYDLLSYYLASDLMVLPSHYDGFPNVLIESASLARPVVASSIGGMRDLLTDGDDSILFAAGDEHSCREAIARAATLSDEDLQHMGSRIAAVARGRCDARDEARTYLQVLRTLKEDFLEDLSDHRSRASARGLWWRAR